MRDVQIWHAQGTQLGCTIWNINILHRGAHVIVRVPNLCLLLAVAADALVRDNEYLEEPPRHPLAELPTRKCGTGNSVACANAVAEPCARLVVAVYRGHRPWGKESHGQSARTQTEFMQWALGGSRAQAMFFPCCNCAWTRLARSLLKFSTRFMFCRSSLRTPNSSGMNGARSTG